MADLVVDENGVAWCLRNYNQGDAVPPGDVLYGVEAPWFELYGFMVDLFQQWVDWYPGSNGQLPEEQGMCINSWYRTPIQQASLRASQGSSAAKISLHSMGLAFDVIHPTGNDAYAQMQAFAESWWGGPAGLGNPSGAWWTYQYEGPHFHIQRFTGNSPDWYAWVGWAQGQGIV
jgi:hypothetical protein